MKKTIIFIICALVLISMISFADRPPETIEILKGNKKFANTNGIILSVDQIEWCDLKSDNINDGYKVCNSIIEVNNTNNYPLVLNSLGNRFGFYISNSNRVKDSIYSYFWSENYRFIEKSELDNYCYDNCIINKNQDCVISCLKISEEKEWYNWHSFNDLEKGGLNSNEQIAIKVVYEIPQYDSASYNFSLVGQGFKAIIDPNISSCGTISTANTFYTMNQSISTSGSCFVITANNVTIDFQGFNISSDDTANGVNIDSANKTTIMNGKVFNFNTGIYIANNHNTTIKNMTLISNSQNGIDMLITNNNTLKNITIDLTAQDGFRINSADNNSFNNITVLLSDFHGFEITSSNNNSFINIESSNNIQRGISITSSDNNSFINLTINNNNRGIVFTTVKTTSISKAILNNNTEDSILLDFLSINNVLNNIKVNANSDPSGNGAIFIFNSKNNTFRDSVFNTTQSFLISHQEGSTNNIYINCSYDISKELLDTDSELIRKWYLDAQVNYTNGTSTPSANVSGFNITNISQFSVLTNSSGKIDRQELIDYVRIGPNINQYNNYTINTTKSNLITDTQYIDLSDNRNLQINLNTLLINYSGLSNNASTLTKFNTNVKWTVNFESDNGLDSYIFAHNNSRTMTNQTIVNISGTTYTANETITINLTKNEYVCGKFWFNDTGYNQNQTILSCFTVQNTLPTHGTPILNSTDNPNNKTTANLTGYNISGEDKDNEIIIYNYRWFKNDVLNSSRWINDSYLLLNVPFDSNSTIDIASDNDGTRFGNITKTTGKIGDAMSFDGVDDYINFGNDTSLQTNLTTVSAWFFPNELGSSSMGIVSKRNVGVSNDWQLTTGSNGKIAFTAYINGISKKATTSTNFTINGWNHIVGIYNGSHVITYLNGVIDGTPTAANGSILLNGSSVWVGAYFTTVDFMFNGTIDEVKIYNRSLSSSEVRQLYDSTRWGYAILNSSHTKRDENWTIEFTPYDSDASGTPKNSSKLIIQNTVPDAPTLVSPINQFSSSNNSIILDWSVSDVDNDNLFSYVYGDTNTDPTTLIFNGSNKFFNWSSLNDTTYYWKVHTDDGLENSSNSSIRSFTVSTTAPAINPEYLDNTWLSLTNFTINFTATDSNNISECQLWHNDTSTGWHKNQTLTGLNTGVEANFSSLVFNDEIKFFYNIWCNDTLGDGIFFNNNITVGVDTVNPNLVINNPTTGDTFGTITGIPLNNTVLDFSLDKCIYNITFLASGITVISDTEVTCNSNTTFSVDSFSSYILTFKVNDSAGNINITSLNITLEEAADIVVIGGGGGGSSVTPTIIQNVTTPFCGDTICQDTEDIFSCPEDCREVEDSFIPGLIAIIMVILIAVAIRKENVKKVNNNNRRNGR